MGEVGIQKRVLLVFVGPFLCLQDFATPLKFRRNGRSESRASDAGSCVNAISG